MHLQFSKFSFQLCKIELRCLRIEYDFVHGRTGVDCQSVSAPGHLHKTKNFCRAHGYVDHGEPRLYIQLREKCAL